MAPELALDFDMPHISTREAVATWMIGFGTFAVFFDQKGLMAGLGLQGTKITRLNIQP